MSKALRIVAVAGAVVATVATAGAASPALLAALGVSAGTMATVATIASIAAVGASIGSQMLAKPPPARGSVSQIIVDPDAPQPYVMGEGYYGGILRHDTAWGAAIKKVPNPYRFMAVVYSGGGPVQSISPRVDFEAVSSWYSGFLYTDTQLGACPESNALAPQWAGTPGWGSSSKLSGYAAIGWSMLFDKDGKVFSSGMPLVGAYGQWVKVYDPRKDSTFPGGSGSHRIDDETTYEWSENPALHAGQYAYGRHQNGVRTFGMGLPADAINWAVVAAWANVCDANSWTMFGVIYEGVGAGESERRWDNLKDICFAGGAEPIPGGVLSFKYSAPQVALDTITMVDLTDDDASVTTTQTYRDRINTVIPKYRSENHNWELVDGAAVVNSTFLTEDGEAKREVWPFNFVKKVSQATQLAAYRMYDSRELPVTLICKPRLRSYRPGECLYLDLPGLGLDIEAIILRRFIDPVDMTVTLELITETTAKHAYCLGQTGTAPPTPALSQTGEERDLIAAAGYNFRGIYSGAETYYLSDVVSAVDGRAFVYINPVPAAGNALPVAPATGTSHWGLWNAATAGAPSGTTVAGLPAVDVASTIAAGGGVAPGQVSTAAIQAQAVSAPFLVSTGMQVLALTWGAMQPITGLSFSATVLSGEVLDLDLLTFPLWSGNDGTRFSLNAYLLRDGVVVALFGQVMDTNDMATNNQGGFAVPVGLFARVDGNGTASTYSVELQLNASLSESNSGGSKTWSAPLDFRIRSSQLRGRRFSR